MSKAYWVALTIGAAVGGRTMTGLLQHFGSLEAIFAASADDLMQVRRVGPHIAGAITRLDLPAFEAQVARFEQQGIQIITWEDANYPANLLCCDDAPPVLFVRGAIKPEDSRAVAIVGTRTPTPISSALARRVAREMALRGWTVVSGLAAGIDTAAHRAALEAMGRTLAVLGSGVANIYPHQNRLLAEAIEQSGAVLCEVHPLASVSRQSLIARNRITSGLSRAVIVVQSGQDSGSANTARRALLQGRTVLVATDDGTGQNDLQAEGAEELNLEGTDWDELSARLDRIVLPSPSDGT